MPVTPAARPHVPLTVPKGQHPAAEGTLGQTPLLHLYVYLLDKSLTGTMVLIPPSGPTVGLFVREGCPTRAQTREGKTAEERFALEKALVDLCMFSADVRYGFYPREDFFGEGNELSRTEPLAKIMAAARACIDTAYAASTLRKVTRAASIKLAQGATPERFRLTPEERALVERLRKQAIPLSELVSTSGVPEQIVRGVIYGLTITRHLDFGIPARPPVGVEIAAAAAAAGPNPSATGTNPGASVTNASATSAGGSGVVPTWTPLRAGTTSAGTTNMGLMNTATTNAGTTNTVAANVAVTNTVTPEPSAPRVRVEAPETDLIEAPPSSKMPVSYRVLETISGEKRRGEIEAKLASFDKENHFQLLGITENATVLEIRDAYFGMARIFHPDRLVDYPDLRLKAAPLFSRITSAYNELSDDKRRAAYIAKLKAAAAKPETSAEAPISDEQEILDRAVNATFEAQKAEVFLKKNEFVQAEAHAARAARADPEQPAYTALLVWIQAQQRPTPQLEEGQTSHTYDDLIKKLDEVLKKEPDYERAIFYRAVLLQKSGNYDRAIRDYTRALELNPRNIEAAREVRLAKLRGKSVDETLSSGSNNKSGGLFGKLFKR